MIKKLFLALAALVCSLSLLAQEHDGGVKGTVINRVTRETVEAAQLQLLSGAEQVAETTTDESGNFLIPGLADGMYTLVITSNDFLQSVVNVTVNDGYVKNMFNLSLTPAQHVEGIDDSSLYEFDMDDSGYNDNPTVLFGSNDIFNEVAGYNFSAVRFRTRGYSSESQDVYLAGVKMNDAITGYGPWSLWSGLNEATRSKDVTVGNEIAEYGFGGYNGTTNIFANATSLRKGLRFSVLSNSALYRLRLMASYASGQKDNGWAYAFNVSARLGGNDWVKGQYYRSFAYYAAAEKVFDDANRLGFFVMGTPGVRGKQNASTQEVYDLVGDNMYNSNWGYQNGKVRNSREARTHEPIAAIKYDFMPNEDFSLSATLLGRFGRNGNTALDWYDAQDPRPDYYRNLPSYYYMENSDYKRMDRFKYAWAKEVWTHDWVYPELTHVNWDRLYAVNQSNLVDGLARSKYVVEERRADQLDLNFATTAKLKVNRFLTLNGGIDAKVNRTEHFKKLHDLLGGTYYLNVDNFADRDFATNPEMVQNDLEYYMLHGHPQTLLEGDKYGYDYYAHVRNLNGWLNASVAAGNFSGNVAAKAGASTFWREGLWQKGLFPDNSKGNSAKQNFFVYAVKGGANYVIGGHSRFYANVGYYEDAPVFNMAFVSPRTRNTVVDGLTTIKTFSSDVNFQYSNNGWDFRITGFYTTIADQSDVMSFYDDLQNAFTNFAMTGIDQRHVGTEMGFRVPLPIPSLSLQGAVSYGEYVYTSNPYMTQTVDNSEEVTIKDQIVPYWKSHPVYKEGATELTDGNIDHFQKHYVPSTPQLASSIGLSWNRNYWFIDADFEYFAHTYLDMNPLYRTDMACAGPDKTETAEEIAYMAAQEEFAPYYLLNFSIGKSWYIQRKYQLGFNLSAKNLLNNTSVKTGGYEQTRLVDNTVGKERYYRFDPKYFYMSGFNYMLNIYFRF